MIHGSRYETNMISNLRKVLEHPVKTQIWYLICSYYSVNLYVRDRIPVSQLFSTSTVNLGLLEKIDQGRRSGSEGSSRWDDGNLSGKRTCQEWYRHGVEETRDKSVVRDNNFQVREIIRGNRRRIRGRPKQGGRGRE